MAGKQTKYDFSGYVTRYGLLCTDGRTIKEGAFKHMDGAKIPMVWQHGHDDVKNVLGHGILEDRPDGTYVYGFFNDTDGGRAAKKTVEHKDIVALSIFANHLVEKSKLVHSGDIREFSLVLSGSNPGAFIENVSFTHSDGSEFDSEDEAIISPMLGLDFEKVEEVVTHADDKTSDELTVGEIFDGFDEIEKKVVYALLAQAMSDGGDMSQSDINDEGEKVMKHNVFADNNEDGKTLTHAQLEEFATAVFADLPKYGSFKQAFMAHAGTYGIDNIEYLFPDATMNEDPSFLTRRMGWVPGWLSGTRHVPFSRLKKVWADLTPDAARAKGYVKGNQKVEQVFGLLKRTTEPTTVYKKQKLDRDDVTDVSGFDVVAWMWREMRFMLDEEVARAALVGDGRTALDDDHIDPTKIRPIYGDDALFVHYLSLAVGVTDPLDIIEAIQTARVYYKGTGTPTLYTTNAMLTSMLLVKDTTNRRIYKSVAELASDLRVADVIEVEVLEGVQRTNVDPAFTANLLGIMVNPYDYTYGTDKGGQISTFDQFDIDYNQLKYLIETRLSGSLLNPYSALVVERKTA